MRTFHIDFLNPDNSLPDGNILGNQGEHNATVLTVTPPAEMTANEKITSYRIAFELTNCRSVRSGTIAKSDVISLPLFSQITSSETVAVQLEGYDGNGEIIIKSLKIKKLKFNPSVCGIEISPSDSPNSMAAEVTANTAFRNNFKEDEKGNLTYKDKLVTERKTFSITGKTSDEFIALSNFNNSISLYLTKNTHEIEEDEIVELENKEIKSFKINIEGTVVDIKNLSGYDGLPYIVNMDKLSVDNSGMLLALIIYSPGSSTVIEAFQNYTNYDFELEIYK